MFFLNTLADTTMANIQRYLGAVEEKDPRVMFEALHEFFKKIYCLEIHTDEGKAYEVLAVYSAVETAEALGLPEKQGTVIKRAIVAKLEAAINDYPVSLKSVKVSLELLTRKKEFS